MAAGRLGRVAVAAASAAPGEISPGDAAANPANPAPRIRRIPLRGGTYLGLL